MKEINFAGRSLCEIQERVGEWSEKIFSNVDTKKILEHLKHEVEELIESEEPHEAADVFLLLTHWCYRKNINLTQASSEKFNIITNRKWLPPDNNGIVKHVPDEGYYEWFDMKYLYRLNKISKDKGYVYLWVYNDNKEKVRAIYFHKEDHLFIINNFNVKINCNNITRIVEEK